MNAEYRKSSIFFKPRKKAKIKKIIVVKNSNLHKKDATFLPQILSKNI